MQDTTLPSAIVKILRENGEKRIKSVFWSGDNNELNVFLTGDQPLGRKSFTFYPTLGDSIESIVDGISKQLEETLQRGDTPIEFNAEEEYDAEEKFPS